MDRRRFLKYAGTTAALVGASALGLDYILETRSAVSNQTLVTSIGSTVSSTTPIIHTTDLKLTLFADWHGDGKQQSDEPTIKDVSVVVQGIDNNYQTAIQADSNGEYWIRSVQVGGRYLIYPKTPRFKFLSISNSDFRGIGEGLTYEVANAEPLLSLGLMEGFLSLPFTNRTKYSVGRFYDWDPRPKTSLWWNGERGTDPNNHIGIDYDMKEGEDIVASAPGRVLFVGSDSRARFIVLSHGNSISDYGHISEALVSEGQSVSRGDLIAKSGSTFNQYPHLHFQLALRSNGPGNVLLDPYRPLFDILTPFNGYWSFTQSGDWTWIPNDSNTNPNLLNYWTKDNDPQYVAT